MAQDKLIACHDCDALYRKPRLPGRQSARCSRCGATLYSSAASQLDRICAVTVAALVTFLIAQSFPIIELDANGITTESSLFGALVVLWHEDMEIVAVMVFCATILFPLTEMVALLYVLLPIRRGFIPLGFNRVLRAIQFVRPWGMLEVFMLGVLITIVKMVSLARVIPETALFAFGALTLMFTVVVTFDARTLWDIADGLRDAARAPREGGAGPDGQAGGAG
ncbi:MAG TPA: paraquat-inducible protein A, partial [Paraburkholderia sp.]